MKSNEEQKEKKTPILEFKWRIPDCCRLGLESCPHVPKKQRKVKSNVGL